MKVPFTKRLSASEVCAHMADTYRPGVYVIGCRSRRVTILSQQTRAFNIIWALDQTIGLKDKAIAVVGGGFAGLSAAAGAVFKGAKVTVYEERPQLLSLQRGNYTRFLHPNVLEWPHDRARIGETHKLPFLNWKAAPADSVVNQVLKQWALIEGHPNLQVHCGHTVESLLPLNGKLHLTVNGLGFTGHWYDAVIIAVGFGLETVRTNVRGISYWENDPFHQAVLRAPYPRRFLVSGCGDGGLVDVLRLRLINFQHDSFVEQVLIDPHLDALREPLLDCEARAKSMGDSDAASVFLMDEYRRLLDGISLNGSSALPTLALRPDTHIVLNGTQQTPLNIDASIFNRFAIFLLMYSRDTHFAYKQGRILENGISLNQNHYQVRTETHQWAETFDEIIIRHGPSGALDRLAPRFPKLIDENTDLVVSTLRHWSPNFFDERSSLVGSFAAARRYVVDARVEALHAFQSAVKARLIDAPDAQSKLERIQKRGDEFAGLAEFELSLLHFAHGDLQSASTFARNAASHLPKIFSWIAAAQFNFYLTACRSGKALAGSTLAIDQEYQLHPLAHRVACYSGLHRGWLYTATKKFGKANASWELVNSHVSITDIPLAYPLIEHTLLLDQLFIDLVANPSLSSPDALRQWATNTALPRFLEVGLTGHRAVLYRLAQELNHRKVISRFEQLGKAWKVPPVAADIAARLELFATLIEQ